MCVVFFPSKLTSDQADHTIENALHDGFIYVLCHCTQAEGLPAVARTATESDSDSGMGSPAEEMVVETANNREELPGNTTIDDNPA